MTLLESTETIFEAEEAKERAERFQSEASLLTVDNAEDMAAAAELREAIKRAEKDAEAARETLKRPVLEEGRRIDGAFAPAKQMFSGAIGTIDRLIRAYRDREEAKRRAEELQRRQEAEKERQRLEKLAARAEVKGQTETADRLQREAEMVPSPIVESRVHTPAGFVPRKVWKFEVLDKPAFLQAVADNPTFHGLVQVDEAALRRMVVALRTANPLPGVRAWEEEEYSTRTQR